MYRLRNSAIPLHSFRGQNEYNIQYNEYATQTNVPFFATLSNCLIVLSLEIAAYYICKRTHNKSNSIRIEHILSMTRWPRYNSQTNQLLANISANISVELIISFTSPFLLHIQLIFDDQTTRNRHREIKNCL